MQNMRTWRSGRGLLVYLGNLYSTLKTFYCYISALVHSLMGVGGSVCCVVTFPVSICINQDKKSQESCYQMTHKNIMSKNKKKKTLIKKR